MTVELAIIPTEEFIGRARIREARDMWRRGECTEVEYLHYAAKQRAIYKDREINANRHLWTGGFAKVEVQFRMPF